MGGAHPVFGLLRNSRPFFTQISGRNFLPELCGEVHPQTGPLQALCCALCSTEQSTVRGGEKGEKVPRKGEESGWPAKGAKRKKGRVKTGQIHSEKLLQCDCNVTVIFSSSQSPYYCESQIQGLRGIREYVILIISN